jgi:hypothetical protein
MLQMPSNWRFGNPGEMSVEAMHDFRSLIEKISAQGDSWSILETFKSRFNGGASPSSSESWASSDLDNAMRSARSNAPAFIDAFWTGVQEISQSHPAHGLPDEHSVNAILVTHGEPYELRASQLIPRQVIGAPVVVNVPPASVDEKARALIEASLARAGDLLNQQHPRQAVQEILWLLETISTAFDGRETSVGTIEGKYFNAIVRELIKHGSGGTRAQVAKWISSLHGYLSSPSGGGVRHGTDLNAVVEISMHEAMLYCNLTKSYIDYLLAELAAMPAAVRS